jgi:hypothetical protein
MHMHISTFVGITYITCKYFYMVSSCAFMRWRKWLVTGLSSRRPGLNYGGGGGVELLFVVVKVAPGTDFTPSRPNSVFLCRYVSVPLRCHSCTINAIYT